MKDLPVFFVCETPYLTQSVGWAVPFFGEVGPSAERGHSLDFLVDRSEWLAVASRLVPVQVLFTQAG